ncbi:MAG: tetratricopeptide repeat protein [Desulfuromonadales bacterium]|nr:tetratricopeptide repeat protein [Desulfuromonadales bacterium]
MQSRIIPSVSWLTLLAGLILLSGCAPPPGSSVALKQQFTQIQQQQKQQAEQIEILQQQLSLLQRQMTAGSNILEDREPLEIPAAVSAEISALTDSASSYLAAFSNLASGRLIPAEAGFTGFLSEYPNHQYAPNARYWLADAQLAQGKLPAAAANLRQIIVNVDGQERAPAALALLAGIYRRQQLNAEADEVLEQLRSRYPDSAEAQQLYRSHEPQ